MDSVLRAAAVYLAVFLVFRVAGRRSLADITTFDFVLLLIIGEAVQQGLLGEDFSVTNAIVIVVTLVGIELGLSLVEERVPALAKIVEGLPLVVVENGKLLEDRAAKARLAETDILEEARSSQGLERIDQIKYAVLERNGSVSIIPKS